MPAPSIQQPMGRREKTRPAFGLYRQILIAICCILLVTGCGRGVVEYSLLDEQESSALNAESENPNAAKQSSDGSTETLVVAKRADSPFFIAPKRVSGSTIG